MCLSRCFPRVLLVRSNFDSWETLSPYFSNVKGGGVFRSPMYVLLHLHVMSWYDSLSCKYNNPICDVYSGLSQCVGM